jgi:subtilisin family serine protease
VTAGLSPALEQSIRQLLDAGVVVVGPAGNDAVDACSRMPAAVPGVLAAGASALVDEVDQAAAFSNHGPCVALYAPGVDVESAWSGVAGYALASGTSQAAAHVAGAAALFLEARPAATPVEVNDALVGRATLGLIARCSCGPAMAPRWSIDGSPRGEGLLSGRFAEEIVDVFVTANADAATPTWTHVLALPPVREGSQVLVGSVQLGAAGRWAVRARLSRPPPLPDPPPDPIPPPTACGTAGGVAVIDDHDDLAFDIIP